jgi:hypothetical protein
MHGDDNYEFNESGLDYFSTGESESFRFYFIFISEMREKRMKKVK